MAGMAAIVPYTVRQAQRTDIPAMYKYVELEGWEIDINLLYCMYDMDSRAWFVAVSEKGDIIGCRALAYYQKSSVAEGGIYIVKQEYRGLGIGRSVNQAALKTLGESNIVLSAADIKLYTKTGFVLDYELYLKQGPASVIKDALIKMNLDSDATVMTFKPDMKSDLELYDSKTCGHERPYFFQTWILEHAQIVLVSYQNGRLIGYGCLRSMSYGFEIAPLYTDSDVIAWILLKSLLEGIPEGQEVFINVCQGNQKMMEFVETLPLKNARTLFKMNLRGKIPSQMKKIYSASSSCVSVV